MARTFLLLLRSGLLTLAALKAEQTALSGPVSGVVFDQHAKALRSMVGAPGSAYLGPALATGIEIGSVSPDGKLALVVKAGTLFLLNLKNEPDEQVLQDPAGPVTHIAWSPDSTSALVAGSHLSLWTHLDAVTEQTQLASVEGAQWVTFLTDPGGRSAIGATPGGVYRLTQDRAELLASPELPVALALSPSTGDLYVADKARDEVFLLERGAAEKTKPIAGRPQLIDNPVAIALAPDGHSLLVANAGSRSLVAIQPDTGEVTLRLELSFPPTRLERLASGAYLVSGRQGPFDAIQLLSLGSRPTVFFVPATE